MLCPEIGNSKGSAFIGGHVNNVIQLSKCLSDRGHEITIVTTKHRFPGNSLIEEPISEWANVFTLPVTGEFSSVKYGLEFFLRSIEKINKLNRNKKFDILHGHSGYTMLALLTGMSAKLSKLPSIHSIYCPILVANGSFVKMFSNNYFSSAYLSQVDKVIAVTENISSSLISAGIDRTRITKIPIGIDSSRFNTSISSDTIRNKFNIGIDDGILIFVGNSTNQKGILLLIESLKHVKKHFPKVKLFMALNVPIERYDSPGKLDSDMEQIFSIKKLVKSYNLEGNVIPLGLLTNMPEYLASSDVFVAPFQSTVGIADHPTSMLEAMAIGRPVIATNVGGIPELINSGITGLLIEKNDVDGLANAINELLSNRELASNMGKNGAKFIEQNFRADKVTTKIERLYEEVIINHNRD